MQKKNSKKFLHPKKRIAQNLSHKIWQKKKKAKQVLGMAIYSVSTAGEAIQSRTRNPYQWHLQ